MEDKFYSLKDFNLSPQKDIVTIVSDFKNYINQMKQFDSKSYWIQSNVGVSSTMQIENSSVPVSSFIANDYLGM